MKYYKFLTSDNQGEYSHFDFTEYLPKDGKPGKWLPKVEDLELCESGYHACKREHVVRWINVQIFEVELRGKKIEDDNKTAAQEIRFIRKIDCNDRTFRLFACWCAEQVLPDFEKKYPDDKRPRQAIEVAKRYANGEATIKELKAAYYAYSAADSAAYSAAYYAYSAAKSAADSAYSAAYSAYSAAYSAYSAADSAYSAAYSAYSAADSAYYAYSAADSAAYSAADSAADSAAYSAADSAYSAATKNQSDKFMEMVGE